MKISRISRVMVAIALIVATEVALLADSSGPPCNGLLPESPAPLCGEVLSECEQINATACPVTAVCTGRYGQYRQNVPKECPASGLAYTNCTWATDTTLCSEAYACKKVNGNAMCVKSNLKCATSTDSYRTTTASCNSGFEP